MAQTRPPIDLDLQTAKLARDWFAEARARTASDDAEAAAKRKRTSADDGGGGGFWDWLLGDADGDCSDASGGD